MAGYFFSVRVPKEEAEKIELFRRSFGIDILPPHITIFPPSERVGEEDLVAAVRVVADRRTFMFDWGDVALWPHEDKEYVVIRAARGGWHLTQLNAAIAGAMGVNSSKYVYAPHVTIGKFGPGNGAKKFECEVRQSLRGVLKPFPITGVDLYVKQNGHWEIKDVISLRPR